MRFTGVLVRFFIFMRMWLLASFIGVIFLLVVDWGDFFWAFDRVLKPIAGGAGIFAPIGGALSLAILVRGHLALHAAGLQDRPG